MIDRETAERWAREAQALDPDGTDEVLAGRPPKRPIEELVIAHERVALVVERHEMNLEVRRVRHDSHDDSREHLIDAPVVHRIGVVPAHRCRQQY